MPSERAAALADAFVEANEAVMAVARSCSDTQWRTVVSGEGWTVGVVLHHIAEGHAQGARWLTSMVSGDGVTDSGDDIDRHDVTHATENAEVSVADTIALLQENGRRTELVIRQLSEEDLDRTAAFGPADGQALPVGRLAAETSRHACGHLAHATEAMAASA